MIISSPLLMCTCVFVCLCVYCSFVSMWLFFFSFFKKKRLWIAIIIVVAGAAAAVAPVLAYSLYFILHFYRTSYSNLLARALKHALSYYIHNLHTCKLYRLYTMMIYAHFIGCQSQRQRIKVTLFFALLSKPLRFSHLRLSSVLGPISQNKEILRNSIKKNLIFFLVKHF